MWREIISLSVNRAVEWQLSLPSREEIFLLIQENISEKGRVSVAQCLDGLYSDIHRFPAKSDNYQMFFPFQSAEERQIAVKAAAVKNLISPWVLKVFEFIPTGLAEEEIILARARTFRTIQLELREERANLLSPNLIDTVYWVPVNTNRPYTIGRFQTQTRVLSDPLISAPLGLTGFFVTFTSQTSISETIKVSIFNT